MRTYNLDIVILQLLLYFSSNITISYSIEVLQCKSSRSWQIIVSY